MRVQVRKSSVYCGKLRRIRSSRSCSWPSDQELRNESAWCSTCRRRDSRFRRGEAAGGDDREGVRGPERAPDQSYGSGCRLNAGLNARSVGIRPDVKRTLDSMEILCLPIMALRKRIEQEVNENPLLEMQEQEPTLPDEPDERDNPDVARIPSASWSRTVRRITWKTSNGWRSWTPTRREPLTTVPARPSHGWKKRLTANTMQRPT